MDNHYRGADEFVETSLSKIGGRPSWIDDAYYPKCPKCSKHMKFLGQVDFMDFEECGDSTYYAFICDRCNVTTTTYQQT